MSLLSGVLRLGYRRLRRGRREGCVVFREGCRRRAGRRRPVAAFDMPVPVEPVAHYAALTCKDAWNMEMASVPSDIIVQTMQGLGVARGTSECLRLKGAARAVETGTPVRAGVSTRADHRARFHLDRGTPFRVKPTLPHTESERPRNLGVPFETWQLDVSPGPWGYECVEPVRGREGLTPCTEADSVTP